MCSINKSLIGSVHKSLTALSQTSVLSVQGDLIDRERLQRCFELEESTSASALLISSIDGARAQFVRDGEQSRRMRWRWPGGFGTASTASRGSRSWRPSG
jgi:arginine/lysine/ornithine decarboxylase